jgi:hypothetical protein
MRLCRHCFKARFSTTNLHHPLHCPPKRTHTQIHARTQTFTHGRPCVIEAVLTQTSLPAAWLTAPAAAPSTLVKRSAGTPSTSTCRGACHPWMRTGTSSLCHPPASLRRRGRGEGRGRGARAAALVACGCPLASPLPSASPWLTVTCNHWQRQHTRRECFGAAVRCVFPRPTGTRPRMPSLLQASQ